MPTMEPLPPPPDSLSRKSESDAQTCLNCRWAEWVMTKHRPPRIKKDYAGACTFPTELILTGVPLPMKTEVKHAVARTRRIFPHRPVSKCPTWEARP